MKLLFDYTLRQVIGFHFLIIILLFPCSVHAQTSANLNDRIAISEQIARYSYTADAHDLEGFIDLFTEDAVWKAIPAGQTDPALLLETRDGIQKYSADNHRRLELAGIRSRHHQSGLLFVELTETTARTQNMILATQQGPEDSAPQIVISGFFYDTWRKTDKGWLIETRTLRMDPLPISAK